MEFSVNLSRLPDGFTFPDRLKEKIAFDAAPGRLVYHGFMTKCTYDELSALSDDPEYHRALEQLFVQTSAEVAPQSVWRVPAALWLATAGTVVLALVGIWIATRPAIENVKVIEPSVAVSAAKP